MCMCVLYVCLMAFPRRDRTLELRIWMGIVADLEDLWAGQDPLDGRTSKRIVYRPVELKLLIMYSQSM